MIGFGIFNLIIFLMECSCLALLTPDVMGLLYQKHSQHQVLVLKGLSFSGL